ncbi:chromosomal replication initiator protein DnaA [Patescibacteria group bacterium]|nr:chromosomal replication initiator protein DnaA [Patescibacteria group bacterium]MBU1457326.1 chromosomal replication initiator protein DnaA [Patescibacteria group bacterium]
MEIQAETLWQSVCGELEVSMSEMIYNSWIKPCFVKGITLLDDGRIIVELATPSGYHLRTVDEKYYGQIKQVIERVSNKKCELALVVSQRVIKKGEANQMEEARGSLFEEAERKKVFAEGLNPRFTFETYVVGGSNNLAFAAAKAVVDSPGVRHNPLFIWGGVGVGKTHLMQAVGHELTRGEIKNVTYVTSEQFTSSLVQSIRSKQVDVFKKKYRNVGALLVDDIQFFAGKDSSQEEFFHTFNDLYMKGVPIVLTSDQKPQEIQRLEERLVSRFLGGLTVDIGLPDYEMREAILRQKASELRVNVDDIIIETLAENVVTNAREIEGVLMRLVNNSLADKTEITMEMVSKVIGVTRQIEKRKPPRSIKVISMVAKNFEFRNKDLTGKSRKADLVRARHIAMYLLREELGTQLAKVGDLFGGRDHTTVMHAVEKIKQAVDINQEVRNKVMNLKHMMYSQ